MWYPQNPEVLKNSLDSYLNQPSILQHKPKPEQITGIIVPHAGFQFSGAVAGTAFQLLKEKNIHTAIVIGPSHHIYLTQAITSNKKQWLTPLGTIDIFQNQEFQQADISNEHSITNQIPFLQKLGIKQFMPLMIGQITNKQAQQIAEKISKINAIYIFSTDLSHFLPYNDAIKKDKITYDIIERLDLDEFRKIDACGSYPLLVLFHLCKLKNTKPHLIQYKNSGDIAGDYDSVVGYSSFWF